MTRKRKSGAPQKADESKRQQMSWNMYDGGGLHVVDDNDPSLLLEREQSGKDVADVKHDQNGIQPMASTSRGSTIVGQDSRLARLLIDECDFFLSIHRSMSSVNDKQWKCKLGSFKLQLVSAEPWLKQLKEVLSKCSEFWLYVNMETGNHLVYFEIPENDENQAEVSTKHTVLYFHAKSEFSAQCLEALQLKVFPLVLLDFDTDAAVAEIGVYAMEGALVQLKFSSEGFRPKKSNTAVQKLMSCFHGIPLPELGSGKFSRRHNIEEVFDVVKSHHEANPVYVKISLQHPTLRPRLREYQKSAVHWMLTRERFGQVQDQSTIQEQGLHPLYKEIMTADSQLLYYNKFAGYLVREKPLSMQSPPGGILGDEMGLGKTVEVLACLLAHPRAKLPLPEPLPVLEPKVKSKKKRSPKKGRPTKSSQPSSEASPPKSEPESGCSTIVDADAAAAAADDGDEGDDISKNSLPGVTEEAEHNIPTAELVCTEDEQTKEATCVEEPEKDSAIDENQTSISSAIHENQTSIPPALIDHDYLSPTSGCGDADETGLMNDAIEAQNPGVAEDPRVVASPPGSCDEQGPAQNTHQGSEPDVVEIKIEEAKNESDTSSQCEVQVVQNNSVLDVVDKGSDSEQKEKEDQASTKEKSPTVMKKNKCDSDVEMVPEATYFTDTTVKMKEYFECICGHGKASMVDRDQVQCLGCGLWQHPDCVGYDLTDPYRGNYLCPHCHVAAPPVASGATLIISPNSICHQWVEEIQRHVRKDTLKVLVYGGVHKRGFIQPRTLASQDIVITTYETLRKEIDFVDLPHTNSENGRRFRNPKRFMAIPSPLIAVEWWRICLDEAQMVECTTTKTAEMALKLHAVNRWCVTGTPIQRGIDDLYGLLLFLGVDPYWVKHWWSQLLYEPYCHGNKDPLHQVAAQVLWRTAKKDVIDQICLPAQTEEVHWLTFSPVEEHFYRRQYQDCAREAMKKLSKWTDSEMKLNTLDRYTLHQLLHPLLRLRQACCHPQAVRGSFLPINKSAMTMEELLSQLTRKARIECEESHRQYVAAMNGLAALDIITEQYPEAVSKYREVLMSVEQHKDQLRTDQLQRLHAIHNLQEILTLSPEGIDPTLRDSQLKQQAEELRDHYMAKAAAFVSSTEETWSQARLTLRELQHEFKGAEEWWAELLTWVMFMNKDLSLIEKVRDDLAENASSTSHSYRFRDIRGLEFLLESHLQQLETSHDALVTSLRGLSGQPSCDLVNVTVECCLRPAGDPLKICPFCKAHEKFEEYEAKLFSFVEKGVVESTEGEEDTMYQVSTKRQGTWADSETEKALKSLLSFAKSFRADKDLIEFGNMHIKIFEALKKEFKGLRQVWMSLRERVSSVDELDMATMRLRLRMPEEPVAEPPLPNVIERAEFDQQKLRLKTDKVVGQNDLRKKLGQLLYLKNLGKAQTTLAGGQNPEPCPICQKDLGTKWSVLQCGHCFCLECIRIIVDEYSFGGRHRSLRCAICRQKTALADISYVCTKPRNGGQHDDIRVKGDQSTKIEGVVRCLLQIQKEDPEAKALVFSTWSDVLDVLARALEENGIEYRALHSGRKFQTNLTTFKQTAKVKVLLLTVHTGSNGLNLIEATHVLLVEPILNPAQELQAIGRVNRIGQTKPTVVHRFLVENTIEHRMHFLLQSVQAPVNAHRAEETTLTIGDLTSLFTEKTPTEEEEDDDEGDNQGQGDLEDQQPMSNGVRRNGGVESNQEAGRGVDVEGCDLHDDDAVVERVDLAEGHASDLGEGHASDLAEGHASEGHAGARSSPTDDTSIALDTDSNLDFIELDSANQGQVSARGQGHDLVERDGESQGHSLADSYQSTGQDQDPTGQECSFQTNDVGHIHDLDHEGQGHLDREGQGHSSAEVHQSTTGQDQDLAGQECSFQANDVGQLHYLARLGGQKKQGEGQGHDLSEGCQSAERCVIGTESSYEQTASNTNAAGVASHNSTDMIDIDGSDGYQHMSKETIDTEAGELT